MATPLGTTFLLFLVWVVLKPIEAQPLCLLVLTVWYFLESKLFQFSVCVFFIFLERLQIRLFSGLQKRIYASCTKWTRVYAGFLSFSRVYTHSANNCRRVYHIIFKIYNFSFCWMFFWWFGSVSSSYLSSNSSLLDRGHLVLKSLQL